MRCRVYETAQRPSVCPVIRLHRRRATPQHGAAARRSAADADSVICWMRWQIEREEFRNRAERRRTNTTRYRPGFGETICPARLWQFDGGLSLRRQSGHQYLHVHIRVSPRPPQIARNKDLRQSMDPKIAADLRPSADGSAVRTSLVTGGG